MATIDSLVTQGSVMSDNLRSDTARASLEYKNQLKNAGDIYVGTGTKITNDEAGVPKEIYVTEGKNIQKALNEDIFRVGGKNNIGLTNSDLSGYSNNIGIGKDISIIGNNNILIGNGAKTPISNEYAVIIGDKASSLAGGITIGRNAVSTGTNVVTIGDNADNKAESGIVIGSASTTSAAVSGIALGGSALVKAPNAVQIGKGVNLVENSLQFHNTQIVDGDGRVNAYIAKYASADVSKGTIEERLTNLGFKQGAVEDLLYTASDNIVKRQGNYVMGHLVGDSSSLEVIRDLSAQIGVLPPDFRPNQDITVEIYKNVFAKYGNTYAQATVIIGVDGRITVEGFPYTGIYSSADSKIWSYKNGNYMDWQLFDLKFSYEANPIT